MEWTIEELCKALLYLADTLRTDVRARQDGRATLAEVAEQLLEMRVRLSHYGVTR